MGSKGSLERPVRQALQLQGRSRTQTGSPHRERALVALVALAEEEEEEEALQDRKRAAVAGPEAVAVSAVLVAFLAARAWR
jgi:hypothetical protein